MDKLYVDVYIPAINKSYDLMLSPDLNVKAAAECIFRTISEFEILSIQSKDCVLCDKGSKRVLDGSLTLEQSKIGDGAKLLLV